MTRLELAKEIAQISLLKGQFKLRSGQTSDKYFDKYRFESSPRLLKSICHHWKNILPKEFDLLAGLELGGIPLATALALELQKNVLFVRKEAKSYGTCQFAEGTDFKHRRLLIIEDVVTTGGQVFSSVEMLRAAGAIVENVLCVINRGENNEHLFKEKSLKLFPLFQMSELLPISP
jgi:orotate phosphoribosyltransferase